ncbi:MAG: SMI1/KNR4 family protein [Verrucomicrobiota bacterium]
MPPVAWKPHIIALTEHPDARKAKRDASFFPPVLETRLAEWEVEHRIKLPSEMRSYLLQSDGLEAQRGEIWPVLPLSQWDVLNDECVSPDPWVRFGETEEYWYLLSVGHSPSIYRHRRFGSGEEFFATSFFSYLEKVFRGQG